MIGYSILCYYRIMAYGVATMLAVGLVGFLIYDLWVGQLALFMIANVLWFGFFYIWNVLTLEMTVDMMQLFEAKYPDPDYFTLQNIVERTKLKWKKNIPWKNR